jgi:tRNA threonylcarbamoyladenosine biosynthesis protein TsaB
LAELLSLGFDTSAARCAAALLQGDRLLGQRQQEMARGQAERLMPLLEELLAEAGVGWRDLAVIGCGIGPGNFTGIRISVAAARGLALSLGIPAIGVGLAEATAHGLTRPCRVALPARGDELLWQDFGRGLDSQPRQSPADDLPPGPPVRSAVMPLAEAIARIAIDRHDLPGLPRPAPLYLRPAEAAPARDRGPVMLA